MTVSCLRVLTGIAAAALCWMGAAAPGAAEESAAIKTAREVMEKNQAGVIHVRLVLKMKVTAGGREAGSQERKVEVNGTVIDPSGLTIISNAATDPAAMFNFGGGEDSPQFKIDSSVTDTKMVMPDGKEYPAKVVLRDKDLDLAFVRPDEKDLKLECIPLKKAGALRVLDEVITLSRLDKTANRESAVSVGRVLSVISKPRTRYVIMNISDTGCPAFDSAGNLVGLVLIRAPLDVNNMGGSINLMAFMPVVLPADDIMEAAAQVPAPGKESKPAGSEKPAEGEKAPAPKVD